MGDALLQAVAESAKAGLLNESAAAYAALLSRDESASALPRHESVKLDAQKSQTPVPGVVAVVYEEFFSKGSAVAVQLLKVDHLDEFRRLVPKASRRTYVGLLARAALHQRELAMECLQGDIQ